MQKKKNTNTKFYKFLTYTLIILVIVLMIISFPATQHLTEIVVYP